MKKKNSAKSKMANNNPKVIPISSEFHDYQDALALYRKHPSLPTFFLLLEKAAITGVRFNTLESELFRLTAIDSEQYFGSHGSKYFNKNTSDLHIVSSYRHSASGVIPIAKSLWKFLERFKSQEIWNYNGILVGVSDFDKMVEYLEPESSGTTSKGSSKEFALGTDSHLIQLMNEAFDAQTAKENAAKKLSDLASGIGKNMVPWAAWVIDYLPARVELAEGLQDLSDYLASYYDIAEESSDSNLDTPIAKTDIDKENATSLVKIASYLLFGHLFKKVVYNNQSFDIDKFFEERIELLSDSGVFSEADDQAEYILAISNLLMISAKLDVDSINQKIVSRGELLRDFLSDNNSCDNSLACVAPLPASGFAQVLSTIDPYTDGLSSEFNISQALRVSDYGMPVPWDQDLFDEMFDDAFGGIDTKVAFSLRRQVERLSKDWLIPLEWTHEVSRLHGSFWSDEIIIEKISNALFKADGKQPHNCRFNRKELDDITIHTDHLSSTYHPAIFSRKFSNRIDYLDFSDAEWLSFGNALVKAGQPRHSCTVMALHITIIGIKAFYNIKNSSSMTIPETMRLLTTLSGYKSFGMVRQATADLFDMFGHAPTILKGSLKEFLPFSAGNVISLKKSVEDRYERYKRELLASGHVVTRLTAEARDNLLKGYTLARDKEIAIFNLSSDAVRNYVLAIEGELRSRASDIDVTLAEELKYVNVDVDWKTKPNGTGRRGVFRGLAGICRTLDVFHSLSTTAKSKLDGFRTLVDHKEIDLFKSSMKEFTFIRNAVQHADGSGSNAGDKLGRVEDLIFGKGGLVRILCETR